MKIFIGSSTEALNRGTVTKLAAWIEGLGHQPVRWDDPTLFSLGTSLFPQLVKVANSVDAAILIFGEDDTAWYRGKQVPQPRDNVLLEYGLFAGILNHTRVVIARDGKAKVPSDLDGIILLELLPQTENAARARLEEWAKAVGADQDVRTSAQQSATPVGGLSPEEEMALWVVLEDPRAGDRGAWVYPLHQQLTYRGLTEAQATVLLNRLVTKGILVAVDVPTTDSLTGVPSTAPAYRVTREGLRLAEQSDRFRDNAPQQGK